MVAKLKQNKFIQALTINLLFAIFMLMFFEQKYEMSDDFIMEGILSGAYGNGMNPHMIFVNIIYGYILLPFYKMFPMVSWYFVFYLLISFVALTSVSYVVLCRVKFKRAVFMITCLNIFFAPDMYILIQFTKVAGMTLMAGAFLLIFALFESKSKSQFLIGTLLCLLGSMIRFDVCLLVGPFAVLLVVEELIKLLRIRCQDKKYVLIKDKEIIHIALAGLAVVALILLCRVFDRVAYNKDVAYSDFLSYSKTRVSIVDHGKVRIPKDKFDEVGVSLNDESMIGLWEFGDQDFFDEQRLERISESIKEYNVGRRTVHNMIDRIMNRDFLHYLVVWACVLMLVIGFSVSRAPKCFLIIPVVMCGLMMVCFSYIDRMVYRVEFVVLLATFLTLLYICVTHDFKEYIFSEQISVALTLGFVLMFVFMFLPDTKFEYKDKKDRETYIDERMGISANYRLCKYKSSAYDKTADLIDYIDLHDENFYFLDFGSTIQKLFYDYNPFKSVGKNHYDNFTYSTGVMMQHPDMLRLYEKWNIDNSTTALLKDNVYLVDADYTDVKLEYLREHYDPNVEVRLVDSIEGYNIWKFYLDE